MYLCNKNLSNMKKKVLPFLATAMLMAAAEANNPYFISERRYRQQRDDAIRRRRDEEVTRKALCSLCQKEYEFSIHGEKIMAKSRKDNARHRK